MCNEKCTSVGPESQIRCLQTPLAHRVMPGRSMLATSTMLARHTQSAMLARKSKPIGLPSCKPSRIPTTFCRCIHGAPQYTNAHQPTQMARRKLLLMMGGAAYLSTHVQESMASGIDHSVRIDITNEVVGEGTHPARKGDLLLIHYKGYLKDTGAIFDSTLGGLMYRDGGEGVLRPIIVRLGGDPVPGICAGLRAGLEGMRVGGKRTFVVPPELGFKGRVLAPYAVVPPNSTLVYEVQLLRLSTVGPDELTKGIAKCGQGGAAQQTANCAKIEPAEYL